MLWAAATKGQVIKVVLGSVMDARPSCLCCLRLGLLKGWVFLVPLDSLLLQLWKSDDFGQTWIMIQEHVKSFSWYVSKCVPAPAARSARPAEPLHRGDVLRIPPASYTLTPLLAKSPCTPWCFLHCSMSTEVTPPPFLLFPGE